jgi:MFS family permease
VAFAANGLGGPSFLARLPERQAALDLSDATLGLTLVGLAAGALVVSPVAGRWVSRLGSRRVLLAAGVGLGASLWTAGAAGNAAALFGALVVVGAADAVMDISMNANGAAYEERSGRSVMHRLHGAWSLGALAAAALAATSAAAGLSVAQHLALVGAVIASGVVVTRRGLLADDARRLAAGRPATPGGWARVRVAVAGPIAVLAAATVAGALIEGGATDWSAVQLERLGLATSLSALGWGAFMAGMVGGRLAGDRLTDRFGGAAILRGGMALVVVGLTLGVVVAHPAAFASGLVLAGAGAAGFFPLAFSAAARTPGVAPGPGAATVSLAARIGFLAEPMIMGAVASLVGLRWAFGLVAAVACTMAVAATRIVPPACRPAPVPLADVREP